MYILILFWFCLFLFFFFNDTATTEIYTLSLHDALPIWKPSCPPLSTSPRTDPTSISARSEEHTSELQSPCNLVCRLLLEKKKSSMQQRSQRKPRESRQHDTPGSSGG